MLACRVVVLLFFAIIDPSTAIRQVSGDQLNANVHKWIELQQLVTQILNKTASTAVHPFNSNGFLSPSKDDGSAVLLAAKNIVPDNWATEAYNSNWETHCALYGTPPNFERKAVPLFTIAVSPKARTSATPTAYKEFVPYICALKQRTEMIIFVDISDSLVAPPLGDLCNTMILIRQSFHSARFLATILSERTPKRKPPLCRPIVWGNLSPYLQIRVDRTHKEAETLVFLASKGGTINFAIHNKIHLVGKGNATFDEIRRANLYATIDNTVQLAFRSSRITENLMTGPRFAFPEAESMRTRYLKKRRALRDYLVSEGQDMSTINMLQMLPVLLLAGIITMYIAVNPQYEENNYERYFEVMETDLDSKKENKGGVLEAIKQAVERKISSDNPHSASKGKRGKKVKKNSVNDKTSEPKTAEVTAEGDVSATCRVPESKSNSKTGKVDKDDKTWTKKKSKGRLGSIIKRNRKVTKTQEKTSDNEVTAETGTTAGTEVTAGPSMTAPSSN